MEKDSINGIYLLYGKEEYLLNSTLKKMIKTFEKMSGELVKGINFIQLDDTNISNLIEDIETPAFGYEKKLIVAKNTGLLKKESKKGKVSNSAIGDKIVKYISDNIDIIKDTVVLIFVEKEADKNNLYKTIEKLGKVSEFAELKVNDLVVRLKSICKAYKVNVQDYDLRYFIECCGTDMQELINEIRKLIEFAGENGTIKKEDIDALCIKKLDSVIFDLTDSLGKKDIKNAMQVLSNLKYQKEPVQKILVTLYNHFKKLYTIKLCEKFGKDVALELSLKPNQTFLINKYKNQAQYFKEKNLRNILSDLSDLDYKYKTRRYRFRNRIRHSTLWKYRIKKKRNKHLFFFLTKNLIIEKGLSVIRVPRE